MRTVPIRVEALKTARIATGITGQSITDFVTDAIETKARPILRRYVTAGATREEPVHAGT